jgi:oligopeptide transport system ATP-binding protein
VQDLSVTFKVPQGGFPRRRSATLRALDRVRLTLEPGETLGIVGESGCGKSTLGRAVLKLVEPSAGRVLWLGRDVVPLDEAAFRPLRRDLQIIFQDPLASLDPRMTVGEIVAEPLVTHERGLGRAQVRERVAAALTAVGLAPAMRNRYPHEFSGGQAQRIGIARAMILRPKLVVCDEPVSALDVSIQAQIVQLLMDLQARYGTAYLFISHNLAVVRRICRRILVIYLGRPMELGPALELCDRPLHPYTQALLSAVPIPDPVAERARRRIVLEGDLPSPLAPPSGCVFRTRCPRATALCAEVEPVTETAAPGREVACHHWAG